MQSGRIALCTDKPPGKTDIRLLGFDDSHITGNKAYSGALIDTRLQMQSFEVAWERNLIPYLEHWKFHKRDQDLKGSFLDYLAFSEDNNNDKLYIELKSAVERGEDDFAMYPDCPSLRGQRHVRHLTEYKREGGNSMIVFISALPGAKAFTPNTEKDPEMGSLLKKAKLAEVDIRAVSMALDIETGQIKLINPDLPVFI